MPNNWIVFNDIILYIIFFNLSAYSADQHDDIYPYATFELHRDHPRSPMKMLDNPPVRDI